MKVIVVAILACCMIGLVVGAVYGLSLKGIVLIASAAVGIVVGSLLTKITTYDANDHLAKHHAYDTGGLWRLITGFAGIVGALLVAQPVLHAFEIVIPMIICYLLPLIVVSWPRARKSVSSQDPDDLARPCIHPPQCHR